MSFEVESNNSISLADTVTFGDAASGRLSTADDIDFFRISVDANSILALDFSSTFMPASGWYYALTVYDSLGNMLADSGVGYGFGATFGLGIATAGDYFVSVDANSEHYSGSYRLTLSSPAGTADDYESRTNSSFETADNIVLDDPVKGQAFSGYGDDYYAITTSTAGILSFVFTPPTSLSYASFTISIYDGDHNLLQERSSGHEETFVTDTPGTYFLQVEGLGYDGGNYSISAHLDTIADVNAITLSDAAPISGTLAVDGRDWYKVELTAGATYVFGAVGTTLANPSLILVDANFATLETSDDLPVYTTEATTDLDPQIGYTATSTGTYYLQVSGNGGAGTYLLTETAGTVSDLIPNLLYLENYPNERWNAGSALGTPVSLSYSFLTSTADDQIGFVAMTSTQKQVVRNVLAQYSEIANITFTETTNQSLAQIRFGTSELRNSQGASGVTYASYSSNGSILREDVFMDVSSGDMVDGSFAYSTLIHEIGHALALKHPGNYNGDSGSGDTPYMPLAFDNSRFTTMSYNDILDSSVYMNTPGLLDIAALQYLYGANIADQGQARTFTFSNSTAFVSTLLSSGTNDTIDASNQILASTINLTPGTFSSIGVASGLGAAHDNVGIPFGATVLAAIGGTGNDVIVGNSLSNSLTGGVGNDIIDGGLGTDTAVFTGNRTNFTIQKTSTGFTLVDNSGTQGSDSLSNIEQIDFTDIHVNLAIGANAQTLAAENLQSLEELYVAFFNRVPDADGLDYWITQFKAGQTISQISESFYNAAVLFPTLTGYSSTMSNDDFVEIIYANVLGRSGVNAPPLSDVQYWSGELVNGNATKGTMVTTMLSSAHSFKGDATWGWVPDLLDNKIVVANYFAVQQGLNYNTTEDAISNGMAIAAAVTSADTAAAISLIGVSDSGFSMV